MRELDYSPKDVEELKEEREAEERLNKALDELLDKITKDSRL